VNERWPRAYVEAPEIFDASCRTKDPGRRISARLPGLDKKGILARYGA